MCGETKVMDYVTDEEEFRISRDRDFVRASYFSYFDRNTFETIDISVSIPAEEYLCGIGKLVSEGKCNIDTPSATLKLEKIGEQKVLMYLSQKTRCHESGIETLIRAEPSGFLSGF